MILWPIPRALGALYRILMHLRLWTGLAGGQLGRGSLYPSIPFATESKRFAATSPFDADSTRGPEPSLGGAVAVHYRRTQLLCPHTAARRRAMDCSLTFTDGTHYDLSSLSNAKYARGRQRGAGSP